jgi:hypothetical protein
MIRFKKSGSVRENMIRALVAFALSAANIATTTLVAAFLAIINTLKTNIDSIDALRASIAQAITGWAAQKKALKTALVEMSATIMKAVYAYAVATGDDVLAAKMKISRSGLYKMKYVDLITFVQGAIALVSPLVSSLGDYGVTAAMITLWQTTVDKLEQVVSTPKNAIANREAVNKDIQSILQQCMLLLTEQADQLALMFKDINVNYYNQYFANRKLNPHTLHTQLRATVNDELNQPIQFATVTIDDTVLTGTTDALGYCLITKIPFGWHSVTVTAGENTKTWGPFEFKKGHSLTKHFVSAPAFATASKTEAPKQEVNN